MGEEFDPVKGGKAMYRDIFGKTRVKVGLHTHTTRTDGHLSPKEVAALYREAGYDAIALTDHWLYGEADRLSGLPILPGAEYHVGAIDATEGIYHILCLFADRAPDLDRARDYANAKPQDLIDAIHAAGGLAVLAHPAWSLNTTESVKALKGLDGVEIFNTVSRNTARDDASLLVDLYATNGMYFPLFATDDFHYLDKSTSSGIDPTAFVMVECESIDPAALKKAIKQGRFYASTGPEIHLRREGDTFVLDCSPCQRVCFHSNSVSSRGGRTQYGEDITHTTYTPQTCERYIRASVTDREGRMAFSQIVKI